MNESSGIIVCKDQAIFGYICTSSPEFNMEFPLPKFMITLYSKFNYKDKPLSSYHSLVVGPWCIEKNARGKGIFVNMWNNLENILPDHIELLTTFISTKNNNSFFVAKKIGMEEVTKFMFGRDEFWLLAKLLSKNKT